MFIPHLYHYVEQLYPILLILMLPASIAGQPEPGSVCTIRDLVEYPDEMREMWETMQAMKYHGVQATYYDGREWRFKRGGRDCRLFTESYLASR